MPDVRDLGTFGGVSFEGTLYASSNVCQRGFAGYQEDQYAIESTDGRQLRLVVGFEEQLDPFVQITTVGGEEILFSAELPGDVSTRIQFDDGSTIIDVARPDHEDYSGPCEAGTEDGSDPAEGDDSEDCGDFDCGESCETNPRDYDNCGDYTDSGRAPTYDSSYTDSDDLWGAYGVNGQYVYGAIKACANYGPNSATWYYTLVDGDTNSTYYVSLYSDFSSDMIEVVGQNDPFGEPVEEFTTPRDEFSYEDGTFGLRLDPDDRSLSFYLETPFPDADSPDCVDGGTF